MNTTLVKETRALLPMFGGALLLIALPFLIWGAKAAEFGVVAFGLGCVVLGACSLGNEFQQRTLSLLLTQPISRTVLWRDKMVVLGAAIATSLAVLVVCQRVCCTVPDREGPAVLALTALCAFCGAPWWTLAHRQTIAGMVSTAGVPAVLAGVCALVTERVFHDEAIVVSSAIIILVLYCPVVYWSGYARFKKLEVFDSPERELTLPAGVEAVLARTVAKVSSRFRGPFASLLKKELRLQQISFLLAGLFFLIAGVGFCLMPLYRPLGEGILGGGFGFYLVILPLIAGAIAVAEEKGWDLAEWHLTLPPSGLQQWSVKMLATLSTSLTLGLLLPTAMFLVGAVLLGNSDPFTSPPSVSEICAWALGQLLLTCVVVYAASFSKSALRAILAALVIIAAGFGVIWLMGRFGYEPIRRPLLLPGPYSGQALPQINLVVPGVCVGLMLMLGIVQFFAWSNFRRFGLSVRQLAIQLLVLFFVLALVSLAVIVAFFLAPGSGT